MNIKQQALIPVVTISYWDHKKQMERQADKLKKDYYRLILFNKNTTKGTMNKPKSSKI